MDDTTVQPLYDKLAAALNPADIATLSALGGTAPIEDAAICAAIRGLYGAVLTLQPAEIALFARYDVSP